MPDGFGRLLADEINKFPAAKRAWEARCWKCGHEMEATDGETLCRCCSLWGAKCKGGNKSQLPL
jgi:Zn finger protein HypA/HybF involved in hydrogenase expression